MKGFRERILPPRRHSEQLRSEVTSVDREYSGPKWIQKKGPKRIQKKKSPTVAHDAETRTELDKRRVEPEALREQYASLSEARDKRLSSETVGQPSTASTTDSEVARLKDQLTRASQREQDLTTALREARHLSDVIVAETVAEAEQWKKQASETQRHVSALERQVVADKNVAGERATELLATPCESWNMLNKLAKVTAERDAAVELQKVYEGQLGHKRTCIARLEGVLQEERNSSKRRDIENEQLKKDHQGLLTVYEELRKYGQNLTVERASLQAELKALRSETHHATTYLRTVQSKRDVLQGQLHTAERALAAEQERRNSQWAELMLLRRRSSLAIADIRMARAERDTLQVRVQLAKNAVREERERTRKIVLRMVGDFDCIYAANFPSWVGSYFGNGKTVSPVKQERCPGMMSRSGLLTLPDILEQNITCSICDGKIPTADMPVMPSDLGCTHPNETCIDCWHQWLDSQMQSNAWDAIRCVQCPTILNQNAMSLFATPEIYDRYLNAELRATLSADPVFRWCASPDCNFGQIHEGGDVFVCMTCGFRSCVSCGVPWHANETCTAYQRRLKRQQGEVEASEAFVKHLKQCPGCNKRIEKNG